MCTFYLTKKDLDELRKAYAQRTDQDPYQFTLSLLKQKSLVNQIAQKLQNYQDETEIQKITL